MELTPEDLLGVARRAMTVRLSDDETRWKHYKGANRLPYAPPGVSSEYEALRSMASTPLIRLAVRTPVQRLRVDGVRTGQDDSIDKLAWEIWQANKLDARQRIVYTHGLVFPQGGVVSVWPNAANKAQPHVRVEDPRHVYLHPNPDDPFEPLWAVKAYTDKMLLVNGLERSVTTEFVYTKTEVFKFITIDGQSRQLADGYPVRNPLGKVPFVAFVPDLDADGNGDSLVDSLLPQQLAIDTMRFNLLLAAQFAAYRQRMVTGFDPVLRDSDGNVVYRADENGDPILDANGQRIPIVASPGKSGVDRMIVFPGADTKVFDLQESDLNNYVAALTALVAQFSSTAQVPPQYLVGDFKNVSGDLMVATEATLLSLLGDLQTNFGEAWEAVISLARVAAGQEPLPVTTEVIWADVSPKDLAVIGSAMSQMVPNGAPTRMFLEMLPGATPQKVDRWVSLSQEALQRALGGDLASILAGEKPQE